MSLRWRDRALRAGLRLTDAVAGPFSPRLRAVCRYGAGLIDSGGGAEFRALVRQRLRLAVVRNRRRVRAATGPAIVIDSRHQRLLPDGAVASKSAWCRPGDLAPLTVSVVVPCFNYGAYLGDALDSVWRQTLGNVEVIVVDDGSTDEETRTCLATLERSDTVRVVRQDNRGLSAARNAGIAAASSEYVCCLDADDRIEPTYLEQAVALLESDRSLGFVGSWVRFFGDASGVWQTRDFEADQALVGNFTSVASVFRRDDWAMLGGYTETMRDGFEDWEFWIRLASAGRRGATIARPLLLHRRHGRNMTDTAKARELTLRAQMRAAFPAFYADTALRARLTRLGAGPDGAPLTLTAAAGNGAGDEARRLLVVVTGLLDGGAHTLLADILSGLGGAWHATIVTTGPGPHALEARFSQVTNDIVHLHGFLPAERWGWFLDHLIRSRHIDAVLSSDCRWHLEQLPRLRATFPTLALLDLTHNHVPTRTLREAMARSPQLDRHVAVSGQVVSALTGAGIPGTRIVHIANGVDPERFGPERVSREVARQRFDSASSSTPSSQRPGNSGSVRLLWVGRMEPVKRPTLFVDLVAALLAQGHEVTGLMIGDGPLADDVDANIRHTGLGPRLARLPFTPRAELPAYYIAADLLVLTSAVEGMPLVVLEAMACGCPVASTDVGDVAQVVVPGVNGLLLAPDSNEAWASSVAGFLGAQASPDATRAAAAAAVRQGPFTLQVMAARWAALLDAVVDKTRVRQ